ncbi:hypothetical protein GS504_02500 [Rhodococcus hoagii]|nr:hypothetical protein [Prescottella equi]NKS56459.1 hypothetical protein [Prescottella equi]
MSRGEGTSDQREGVRKGTIAAAVVVAVIAVCAVIAVVVALTGGGDSDNDTRPTVPVPSTTSGPRPPNASGDEEMQGLGVPTTDTFGGRVDVPNWPGGWALPQTAVDRRPYSPAVPVDAPAGMMWQRVNDGVVVPFSTSDGPTTVDGLSARGFGHSPQGAALAGWQIFFRIAGSNNEVGRAIYDSQVVMGKDMRQQINARLDAEGPYYRSATDQSMKYFGRGVAFRVQEYADDLAVVEYALRDVPGSNGTDQWSVTRMVMVWVDGDWKLQYPDTGVFEAGTANSLDGWTPW